MYAQDDDSNTYTVLRGRHNYLSQCQGIMLGVFMTPKGLN